LPWWFVVGANVVFWPTWTLAVGYTAQRLRRDIFAEDNRVTNLRGFEAGGGIYRECLAIHQWKDRLPEAGALFGGLDKSVLGVPDVRRVDAFIVESRRAELAHWMMVVGVAPTVAWNPRWAFSVNLAVALGSNLPCIAVQRYNRARFLRLANSLQRRRSLD